MSKQKNTWYFYTCTGKSEWEAHLASQRDKVLADLKPEFETVLFLNKTWDKSDKRPDEIHYFGNLYLDWDGEDGIDEVLGSVKRFMHRLQDKKFNLNYASWFLSGKKGVHCLIPYECFIPTDHINDFKSNGVLNLPHVYRLMVSDESLITDHMDLSIYTCGRGRQWRTSNRPRQLADGKITYKVPIEADRLLKLDEEGYWDWCSQPREPVEPVKPELVFSLKHLYDRAFYTVHEQRVKKDKARKAGRLVDFSKFTSLPPTMVEVFKGNGINQRLDLNTLKMQLCIAAVHTQFKTRADENDFIQAISGFIDSRVGLEGTTHKTREQIEKVMREGFRYFVENPTYFYTKDAFETILVNEFRNRPDLSGKQLEDADNEVQFTVHDFQQAGDKTANQDGVFVLTKDGDALSISNYSWKEHSVMKVVDSLGFVQAYSVIPIVGGMERPRAIIPLSTMLSSKEACSHVMTNGGYLANVSNNINQVHKALQLHAKANILTAPEVEVTTLEGFHIKEIQTEEGLANLLGESGEVDYNKRFNFYWVEAEKVIDSDRNVKEDADGKVINTPMFYEPSNQEGLHHLDLSKAKYTLANTKTPTREAINALLELNGNHYSMAVLFGWFTANFFKYFLHKVGRAETFPLLQVYGEAGCGKTTTLNLMLKLFAWNTEPKVNTPQGTTHAAIRNLAVSTATVPLVFDEIKFQNLGAEWLKEFQHFLNNVYTLGGSINKAGGRGTGSHHSEMVQTKMYCSVAYLGETLETSQTSLMERTVATRFMKSDKVGRENYVYYLQQNHRIISLLGWTIASEFLHGDKNEIVKLYDKTFKEVNDKFYSETNHRMVKNASHVLTGFRYFASIIEKYHPQIFSEKLKSLEYALLNKDNWTLEVANEIVRLLNFISQCSHLSSVGTMSVLEGTHYRFEFDSNDNLSLILACDRVYFSYRERMRILQEQAIYKSSEELYHALKTSSLAEEAFTDEILGIHCVRFLVDKLNNESIQPFKGVPE